MRNASQCGALVPACCLKVWPPGAAFSFGGHLFDYYHFLVEFAPRVLQALDEAQCEAAVLFVPHAEARYFELEGSHGQRSTSAIFTAVFGARLTLQPTLALPDAARP
eukprot:4740222-Prymnesium_polylepis.1